MSAAAATILLVDEYAALRLVLCKLLEAEGYTVFEAATGAEALARTRALRGSLDVLIADLSPADMDAVALADHLAARHRGLRLLLLSGGGPPPYPEWHRVALKKPFDPDDVLRAVRAVLGRTGREP